MSVAPSPVSIVVDLADSVNGERFISAVDHAITQKGRVAFDCEGVDLSRLGTVEIVSVCFPSKEVYLVDFSNPDAEIIESDTVTKIIHDAKMDADALFHVHGIRVNNIHDTLCFHEAITHIGNHKNLNDTLIYNGISPNDIRDSSVYKWNPRFWASRPSTSKMIAWASSDVISSLTLQISSSLVFLLRLKMVHLQCHKRMPLSLSTCKFVVD